jgi:hypothetical protein
MANIAQEQIRPSFSGVPSTRSYLCRINPKIPQVAPSQIESLTMRGDKPSAIVDRERYLLLGVEIAFGGLDRGVPDQEPELLQTPPFFRQSLAAGTAEVWRRSWAPKCSIPICFNDCSTIDQPAQSLRVSRLILPFFEIDLISRPSSILAVTFPTTARG